MKQALILVSLVISKLAFGVELTPGNSASNGAEVTMTTDSRTSPTFVNGIVNNKFQLGDEGKNELGDWGLELNLDADEYGFQEGEESTLTITIDGDRTSGEADVFLAFSIGNSNYITFVVDLDGGFDINWDTPTTPKRRGNFIYPDPSLGTGLANGDASTLYANVQYNPSLSVGQYSSGGQLRRELGGGSETNWALFKSSHNTRNKPDLTFTIVNNDAAKTLSISFDGVTKTYTNTASLINQDFKLFMGSDVNTIAGSSYVEVYRINKFTITGDNVGLEGCDFDINAYLDRCYCADIESGMGSPFSNYRYTNNYGGYDNNMNKYNYGGYNNYEYPQTYPQPNNNINYVSYLSLMLNIIILTYIVCINGCGKQRGYHKVYDSEN